MAWLPSTLLPIDRDATPSRATPPPGASLAGSRHPAISELASGDSETRRRGQRSKAQSARSPRRAARDLGSTGLALKPQNFNIIVRKALDQCTD